MPEGEPGTIPVRPRCGVVMSVPAPVVIQRRPCTGLIMVCKRSRIYPRTLQSEQQLVHGAI